MTTSPDLLALAMRVDEQLVRPANMATTRQLAAACLCDRALAHVDALQFPNDPNNDADFTDDSMLRELGRESYTVFSPGQTALVLAALHEVYCHNVEAVIVIPADLGLDQGPASDYSYARRWTVILDRVRSLGDWALPWFELQFRRFVEILSLANAKLDAGQTPAPAQPPQDGPASPNLVRWRGSTYELPPVIWRILNYLWCRDVVMLEDLAAAIWGDESDEVPDARIRSRLSELNRRLGEIGIPHSFSIQQGHVRRR